MGQILHIVVRDVIMECVQEKVELRERRSINVNVGMGGEGRNVNFVGEK